MTKLSEEELKQLSYVEETLAAIESNPISTDYKLAIIRGIPQNPTFDINRFEDIINNFVTKDSDVFITTYVKSGTTWTQEICHQLLSKGLGDLNYSKSCPWLEALASNKLHPNAAAGYTLEDLNNMDHQRFFKSHATVRDLPRGKANIKIIYIARNPKDVCVSLYHHAKNKPEFGYTGNFETFVRMFLAGHVENGSWFNHVLEWYEESISHPESHLFLKYEDMYQDPLKAIKTISSFIGIDDLNEDDLQNVLQNSSLSEMRKSPINVFDHIRVGGYGGWRTYFSVATNDFFDDVSSYI